jgi:hypothetical protein
MTKRIIIVLLALSFACVSKQETENLANSNANNNSNKPEEEAKNQRLEDAFRVECKCRELFYRIRDEGGSSPDAIAKNLVEADPSISIRLIMKNPLSMYGKAVAFTGRIAQIRETEVEDGILSTVLLRVGGKWDDLVTGIVPVKTPFLEGDRVTIVGYLANHTHDYKSVSQWDMSVPIVTPRAMIKPSEATQLKRAYMKNQNKEVR